MNAYKKIGLYNQQLIKESKDAFRKQLIDEACFRKIIAEKASNLYSPNMLFQFGMGLLTIVIVIAIALLFSLMFYNTNSIIVFAGILGIVCYIALELLVGAKHYFNAGIDNVLLIAVLIFMLFTNEENNQMLIYGTIGFLVSGYLSYRFVDSLMAVISFFCFLLIGVEICSQNSWVFFMPILLMVISILVFVLSRKLKENFALIQFNKLFTCLYIASLVVFYAAGNYFVIGHWIQSNISYNSLESPIAPNGLLSAFLWLFTFAIPPIYIWYGIKKKDLIFIRTGIVFIAVSVFTVRYYHSFMRIELALTLSGLILIAVSYWLIKFLGKDRNGYTSKLIDQPSKSLLNLEALILAQTFTKTGTDTNISTNTTNFGGGSGGGGGASGTY